MPIRLFIAPAASGKTAYVLERAREATRGMQTSPRVVTPTGQQVVAGYRRLAQAGGALGVRITTMNGLAGALLDEAGTAVTAIADPVQVRLLRAIVDQAPLEFYLPLRGSPGFIQALRSLFGEFQAALIEPQRLQAALADMDAPPRLQELALLFSQYQEWMQAIRFTDGPALLAWALAALDEQPALASDWGLLLIDGFDRFTPAEQALIAVLSRRIDEVVVTLTGSFDDPRFLQEMQRAHETRMQLQRLLGVEVEPLPAVAGAGASLPLRRLSDRIFGASDQRVDLGAAVTLVAAPDQEGETRAALRWLKLRLHQEKLCLADVALLARDLAPYREAVVQIAAEFELPVRILGGLPLAQNPAIAALRNLLQVVYPVPEHGDAFVFRRVVDAWRSPYFDWRECRQDEADPPLGIGAGDADRLDAAGRWGRVVSGWAQWQETLDLLARRTQASAEETSLLQEEDSDQDSMLASALPAAEAQALQAKLHRFAAYLAPPAGRQQVSVFVQWLERIIGEEPEARSDRLDSLRMVERIHGGEAALAERDLAALRGLKEILRGLVWAESILGLPPVDYATFVDDLSGALDAASYSPDLYPQRDAMLVAEVTQARGLALRAAAVVGLAEGAFPATVRDDPFLHEEERAALRGMGLPLEPVLRSYESWHFYEATSRASGRLYLSRPRLAASGADWPESPYWQEIERVAAVKVETMTHQDLPTLAEAASWPEVMAILARREQAALRQWVASTAPQRLAAWEQGASIARARYGRGGGAFDGDLSTLAATFQQRYRPQHLWSASRLETYLSCPYRYFAAHVLDLEPRSEPALGLDRRQLGSIYHRLLAAAYDQAADRTDLAAVLAALELVAGPILDQAPQQEGFRPPAWWPHTREEIMANVRSTIEALTTSAEGWTLLRYEAAFGMAGQPALEIGDGDDRLRFRGQIDRVDTNRRGQARIIDYKSAYPASYNQAALRDGKYIQLPIYALAAQEALGLGQVADGFYWHVRESQASPLSLAAYPPSADDDASGVEAAVQTALAHVRRAAAGARNGRFQPAPPSGGCPDFCPAAAFCWHYRPGSR